MIVCDTNVLISAFLFRGSNPDKIFRAILSGRFQHATSPDILTELKKVFIRKFKIDTPSMECILDLVKRNSMLVYPEERLSVVTSDPTDNRILECAVTAKAEYLVTGDKKHLIPLKTFQSVAIVSPAAFVDAMKIL